MPLMEFRSVGKVYRGGGRIHEALKPIDLRLESGKGVGLVGESGAGKSTLAWLALGLIGPTTGKVLFKDADIWTLARKERLAWRRSVQAVFQNPSESLNPRMHVSEIISEPLLVHGIAWGQAARAEVMKLLDLVMLPTGIMERRPYELSGGQQQRVAIARALALKPQMIVMDEPVSALDMSTRGSVLRLLKRLKQEFGIAYLYISHDLMTVSALCDRVIILRHGQIEEEAEVEGPGFVPGSNYGRELYNSLRLSRATGKPVSS